jgi:hypothetical protein
MEPILLPSCGQGLESNEEHQTKRMELLKKGLRQALMLRCDQQHNIYAYRLCKCAVFHSSEVTTKGQPIKLTRSEPFLQSEPTSSESTIQSPHYEKLFDYENDYIQALKEYLDGQRSRPDPRVFLVFGQKVTGQANIDNNVLILVTVATKVALEAYNTAEKTMALRSPNIFMSASNEFDRLISSVGSVQLQKSFQSTSDLGSVLLQKLPSVSDVGFAQLQDSQFEPDFGLVHLQDSECVLGLESVQFQDSSQFEPGLGSAVQMQHSQFPSDNSMDLQFSPTDDFPGDWTI